MLTPCILAAPQLALTLLPFRSYPLGRSFRHWQGHWHGPGAWRGRVLGECGRRGRGGVRDSDSGTGHEQHPWGPLALPFTLHTGAAGCEPGSHLPTVHAGLTAEAAHGTARPVAQSLALSFTLGLPSLLPCRLFLHHRPLEGVVGVSAVRLRLQCRPRQGLMRPSERRQGRRGLSGRGLLNRGNAGGGSFWQQGRCGAKDGWGSRVTGRK